MYFRTSHNFTFTVPATVGRLLTPHEIKAATQPNTVEQLAAKALHFWGPMVRFDDFVSWQLKMNVKTFHVLFCC